MICSDRDSRRHSEIPLHIYSTILDPCHFLSVRFSAIFEEGLRRRCVRFTVVLPNDFTVVLRGYKAGFSLNTTLLFRCRVQQASQ